MDFITDLNDERWLPEWRKAELAAERKPKPHVYVGLDLGQAGDYSALSAVEYTPQNQAIIRNLERHRGVPYPDIVDRVVETLKHPRLVNATFLLDYTGVGRPVFDMFLRAGLKPIAVQVHGGANVTPQPKGYNVPKRDLVFALVYELQAQRLVIPQWIPEREAFIKELTSYRMKINTRGHDSYEAWRERDHDDLVFSVALCAWMDAYKNRPARKRKAKQY